MIRGNGSSLFDEVVGQEEAAAAAEAEVGVEFEFVVHGLLLTSVGIAGKFVFVNISIIYFPHLFSPYIELVIKCLLCTYVCMYIKICTTSMSQPTIPLTAISLRLSAF
jgi:hypothetical protein